jgi:hypothetical protein
MTKTYFSGGAGKWPLRLVLKPTMGDFKVCVKPNLKSPFFHHSNWRGKAKCEMHGGYEGFTVLLRDKNVWWTDGPPDTQILRLGYLPPAPNYVSSNLFRNMLLSLADDSVKKRGMVLTSVMEINIMLVGLLKVTSDVRCLIQPSNHSHYVMVDVMHYANVSP